MPDNSKALGTEKIGKLLFNLSIPAIVAQLVNLLYNVVDRIYIGHIPSIGSYALTGVGLCFPIIMVVSAFAAIASQGGGPRASIFMGSKDNRSATKVMGNAFAFLLLVSCVLTALILVLSKPLLMVFGASQNTIGYAMSYMNIYALGTVFVQIALGMNAFITAQGMAKTSMMTVVIGAICNLVLDPILIFGFNLGVQGAAIATVISQGVSATWVLSFLCSKKSELRLKRSCVKLEKDYIRPILTLGLGPFVMQSTESLLNLCFNINLQRYGGDIAVGALTILSSVMQFSSLPLIGVGQGSSPIISYNFGKKDKLRVKEAFSLHLKVNLCFALGVWAMVQLFPRLFVSIFTSDTGLVDFAVPMLRIYMGASGILAIQLAIQSAFVSIGYAKASIMVALMRKFVLLIPLIFILPALLADKITAVYMAEPISDTISVVFASTLFFFQFRRALKSLPD